MKVDLVNGVGTQSPVELNTRSTATASSNATAAAQDPDQDRATLSTSNSVSSLVSQAMGSPSVRQDKVNALKQQIASGNYNVDPSKIAQGILSEGL